MAMGQYCTGGKVGEFAAGNHNASRIKLAAGTSALI